MISKPYEVAKKMGDEDDIKEELLTIDNIFQTIKDARDADSDAGSDAGSVAGEGGGAGEVEEGTSYKKKTSKHMRAVEAIQQKENKLKFLSK